MIRVLHLFSNHKLTGPAELALDTALAVEAASQGEVECRFLPARHPKDPFWIGELARERNARLVEIAGLRLQKHFNPMRAFFDSRKLARYLAGNPADILHCHLPNDHLVSGFALRLLKAPIPIIRTIYDGEPVPVDWRTKKNLGENCAGALCFSTEVRDQLMNGEFDLRPERIKNVSPPIDTDRFQPATLEQRNSFRKELNIPENAFVAGIVARMQTHRRFEVLLEAIQKAKERIPKFRFIIIGRGTHQEEVAKNPVRKMGLEDTVIFSGYRGGKDYLPVLQSMDIKIYLVPGSDGTCRAVREALASGIPVIAANRGILPQLVEDGFTGKVIEDSPENLADAMVEIASNKEKLELFARNARESAVKRFSYRNTVQALRELYGAVQGSPS